MFIIDDLMSETNLFVANIFTKISLCVTYKLLEKNRFARTITLNAHYYVHLNTQETPLVCNAGQTNVSGRLDICRGSIRSATSIPYGYLLFILNGPVLKRLSMGGQSTDMFSIKYSRQLVADCYKSFTFLYSNSSSIQ